MTFQPAGFPVRDWLNSGWILKIRSQTHEKSGDIYWLGGFGHLAAAHHGSQNNASETWTPEFFDTTADRFRRTSTWSVALRRFEIERALNAEFTPPTAARAFVSWEKLDNARETFDRSFGLIQSAIHRAPPMNLAKAVPWIFSQGKTAVRDHSEWLVQRLRCGLEASEGTDLRLYGQWDLNDGFLGITPEDLANFDGSTVRTMAVAGTKSVSGLSESEIAAAKTELQQDKKEVSEHQHVVTDLAEVLSSRPELCHVLVEKTEVRQFRHLLHLVTPLTANFVDSFDRLSEVDSRWKILEALHPTPALGTSPRDSGMTLLREIESLNAIPRKGFGAPFAVRMGDRLECVVAIRQMRWQKNATDQIRLEIGSGCGVVGESQLESEWRELTAKRDAVVQAFGLSSESRRPLGWAKEILTKLVSNGVRRFVVCAGARNAPLVVTLEAMAKKLSHTQQSGIQVDSFFEERSAAFYALGISRATGTPVAVVTTSGTAVTELQSAIAEADFSGVPLIALTADRPKRLRDTGAPQSIDQNGIFMRFCSESWDLEEGESLPNQKLVAALSGRRPMHLNMCFEEPLLEDETSIASFDELISLSTLDRRSALATEGVLVPGPVSPIEESCFRAALERRVHGGGFAIVSSLDGPSDSEERELVAKFLLRQQMPCLLESSSGLRGDPRLSLIEIKGGDRDLQSIVRSGAVAQVFRFGGIPTTRVWRDLDDPRVSTQTFSVSKLRFSGLGRGQLFTAGSFDWNDRIKSLLALAPGSQASRTAEVESQWLMQDQATVARLEKTLLELPKSEPGFVRELSRVIQKAAIVYVGNSLPIRWWDWVASRDLKHMPETVYANRGVNGIDGQISTALGLAAGSPKSEIWIIVGDLTALYDLAGLWAAKFLGGKKIRIVVLNNSGGQIFRQVLKSAPSGSAPFENTHGIKFKNWAAMWGFSYEHCNEPDRLATLTLPDRVVLELEPDPLATENFWRAVE